MQKIAPKKIAAKSQKRKVSQPNVRSEKSPGKTEIACRKPDGEIARHPGGRPRTDKSKYIPTILLEIASGHSLCKVCKEIIKIDLTIVYDWLRNDDQFAKQYAKACEDRADTKNDRVSEIIDKVERKEIDPAAARVMIDAIKWQAAHERPKKYGEHQSIDYTGSVDITGININLVKPGGKSG